MAVEIEYDDNPEWDESNSRAPNVSEKLKVIRARLMSSQADFAALLGIPLATLQNWEQRRTEPDAVATTLIELIYQDPKDMQARMMRRNAA